MGRPPQKKTSFLLSRPATSPSHLTEAGDDRNLDQTMGVQLPPGAPFMCLPEAPATSSVVA